MGLGLAIYSLLALKKQHSRLSPKQALAQIPLLNKENLEAVFSFQDAQVDDARLVLRLINDGCAMNGAALNYTGVREIKRNNRGRIITILAEDTETKECLELNAKVVINATGVWAEELHPSPVKGFHLRPLRGSHLIFPGSLFPLDSVLSFFHPADKRPVFFYPWEGCLILGTTDVDHVKPLNLEPSITLKEAEYLMEGLKYILPGLKITEKDCISSIAGVRPVLSEGKATASKESREHVVWEDRGLITVTGGKLTTFRILARDALKAAKKYLPKYSIPKKASIFSQSVDKTVKHEKQELLPNNIKRRLYGRYGDMAGTIISSHKKDDQAFIPGTSTLWDEVAYCAANEQVRHLSDLLLRRVRIGLLLPGGGKEHFGRIEKICKASFSWDDNRWNKEKTDYLEYWQNHYASPFE
jgi:glycerol-3-phosphate dehydrogenase